MPTPEKNTAADQTLEQFRSYLETLTFIQISPALRRKFSLSDIISRTLWEAYLALDRIRELDDPGRKRWLRRMLVNNLLDEIARWKAKAVDYRREEYPDGDINASSGRLESWLETEEAPPGEQAEAREEALRLLDAVSQLPDREREVLILRHYHGWKLREISQHLDCTVNTVAGLHARAVTRLRNRLCQSE